MHTLFALQSSPAPGRPEGPSAPTTAQTQPADAPAPAAPAGGVGGFFSGPGQFLIFLVPLAFLLFMSRNQNKKQRDIEASIKVGDKVVTRAGVIGKVVELGDTRVKLELAPGVKVEFLKTALEGLDPGESKKEEPKKEEPKKDSKDSIEKAKEAAKDKDSKDKEKKKDES